MKSTESCLAEGEPSSSRSHSPDDDEMGSKIRLLFSTGWRIPSWRSPADLTKTF
jgi:hypothetical protein